LRTTLRLMTDPTESITIILFWSALGLLLLGMAGKHLFVRAAAAEPAMEEAEDSSGLWPYAPPAIPHPPEKVPISFYRPLDLLGLGALFFIFFGLTVSSLMASEADHPVTHVGLITSIAFQFILAGIVIATISSRIHLMDWLGLRWPNWPWVIVIAPATVIAMLVLFGTIQHLGYEEWIKSLGVEQVQDTVKLLQNSNDPVLLALMTAAAVIVAPVCEEVIFRGYMYPLASRFAGRWAGGLFSAVIFGCAHGSLASLLPLIIFGLVLVVIYQKTGSLWATIAVHFCFNGTTVAVQFLDRIYHFIPKEALP